VWLWDLCAHECEREPASYPQSEPWPGFWKLSEEPGAEPGWDDLSRGLQMIQNNPIVTIRSLQEFGFKSWLPGELTKFYNFAALEYSHYRPPLMERDPDWPLCDSSYRVLLVRDDVGRTRIRKAFNEWLEKTIGRGWGFNPRTLRAYDTLQYIDLRIFELLSQVVIHSPVKAQLIRDRRAIASDSKYAQKWQTSSSSFTARELDSTQRHSLELLDDDSTSSCELQSDAFMQLLRRWKDTSGDGDGKFVPPAKEAEIWPD
jgi:hypothetical protein